MIFREKQIYIGIHFIIVKRLPDEWLVRYLEMKKEKQPI